MQLDGSGVVVFGSSAPLVDQVARISDGDQPVVAIRNATDVQVLIRECPRINIHPAHGDALWVNAIAVGINLREGRVFQRGIDKQIISDAEADLLGRGKNVATHGSIGRHVVEFVAREVFEVPVIVLGMEHERADIVGGHRMPDIIRVVSVKPLVGIGGAGGGVVHRNHFERTLAKIGNRDRETKQFPARSEIVLDADIRRRKRDQVWIMRRAGGAAETRVREHKRGRGPYQAFKLHGSVVTLSSSSI